MADTYSVSVKFTLQATGENINTWGPKLNENYVRADFAVKGVAAVTVSGPVTLTSSNTSTDPAQYQAMAATLYLTGTGGTVTVPALRNQWVVVNGGTGDMVLSNGSNSVTVFVGERVQVSTDGTLIWKASSNTANSQRLRDVATPTDTTDAANKAYVDSVAASGLPSQTGKSGQYLTTNGTTPAWSAVLPSFTGTSDYFLTSTGSASAWSSPAVARTKLGLGSVALLSNVPIASGGTGATSAAGARSMLGLGIGVNVQPYSANLTAIDAVPNVTGSFLYYAGSDVWASAGTTAFSRSLLTASGASTARTTLGLGGASVLNVGTGSGTVAAGDDSRITGAAPTASPTFTGTPTIGSEKLMRVATGTAANSGQVTFSTSAPGTLALGAIHLRHA